MKLVAAIFPGKKLELISTAATPDNAWNVRGVLNIYTVHLQNYTFRLVITGAGSGRGTALIFL